MNSNYQDEQSSNYLQGKESLPNAMLILVLGILSIFVCQPLGFAALIMGNNSLALYRQNPGRYTEGSRSSVNAGRICGIIGICIMVLYLILFLAGFSLLSLFDFDRDF